MCFTEQLATDVKHQNQQILEALLAVAAVVAEGMVGAVLGVPQGPRRPALGIGHAPIAITSALPASKHFCSRLVLYRIHICSPYCITHMCNPL